MAHIIIHNVGNQKLGVIALLRRYAGLGLKAAKDAFEAAEKGSVLVIQNVPSEKAVFIAADFQAYGASASERDPIPTGIYTLCLSYRPEGEQNAKLAEDYRSHSAPARSAPVPSPSRPVVPAPAPAPVRAMSSELDRNALKIYLFDMLTLECVKNKYLTKIAALDKQIVPDENVYYLKHYHIDGYSVGSRGAHANFLYKGKRELIAVFNENCTYSERIVNEENPSFRYCSWMPVDSNMKYLTSARAWTHLGSDLRSRIKYLPVTVQSFRNAYAEFQKEAPEGYRKRLQNNALMRKQRIGLKKELGEVESLLKKGYSKNIIPGPYRNDLYAVYYLYDFISTSNESFTTALLHFDLNAIKAKLDKIIEQQEEIIINQSVLISQNSQLQEQNQQYLRKLSSIENYASDIAYESSRAADYAQIAAVNSEVCAWVSMANYLGY